MRPSCLVLALLSPVEGSLWPSSKAGSAAEPPGLPAPGAPRFSFFPQEHFAGGSVVSPQHVGFQAGVHVIQLGVLSQARRHLPFFFVLGFKMLYFDVSWCGFVCLFVYPSWRC